MNFCTKALSHQLRICERVAKTPDELAQCRFWREWIDLGLRQIEAQEEQVVNFAEGREEAR